MIELNIGLNVNQRNDADQLSRKECATQHSQDFSQIVDKCTLNTRPPVTVTTYLICSE